jgi:hypothetical protein
VKPIPHDPNNLHQSYCDHAHASAMNNQSREDGRFSEQIWDFHGQLSALRPLLGYVGEVIVCLKTKVLRDRWCAALAVKGIIFRYRHQFS